MLLLFIDPIPLPVVQTPLSQLLAFLTPLMIVICSGLQVWFNYLAQHKVEKKVEEVKTVTSQTAIEVKTQGGKSLDLQKNTLNLQKDTHTLVNGQYGAALVTILEQAKKIADLTQSQEDRVRVELARQDLKSHEEKMKVINERHKKEAEKK